MSSAAEQLLETLHASWMSQAMCSAVELGIPEILSSGPKTLAELSSALKANPASLIQFLRALTTLGLLHESHEGFVLTEMGELLGRQRLGSWVVWWTRRMKEDWQGLSDCVRTGRSSRTQREEATGFNWMDEDPDSALLFHSAMKGLAELSYESMLGAYDFSRVKTLIDVGGGHGLLLCHLLDHYRSMSGVIADQPHAEKAASEMILQRGLSDRARFEPTDFFERVPSGADCYLIKSVLHDWPDSEAIKILGAVHTAARPDSKILLVERVLPTEITTSPQDREAARSDLHMLVAHGARERTRIEFERLLNASGLYLTNSRPLAMGLSLLEAAPGS